MILAINTSTFQFGIALMKEDETVLAEFSVSKGKGHFGGLMPALHFLLTTTKSDIHDLEALVVATGPGSFTGLGHGLSDAIHSPPHNPNSRFQKRRVFCGPVYLEQGP
jgi:tRNA threonylcarbamoyladenosine biosynthesis protein TsaB